MLKNCLVLIMTIGILMIYSPIAKAAPVNIIIEGPQDEYPHYLDLKVPAILENGRTLVPVRPLAEALGMQVEWQASSQGIKVYNDKTRIEMQIGTDLAQVNAAPVKMEPAPRIIMDNTMVPLGFITQACGYYAAYSSVWHENPADVYITPYTLINDEELAGINKMNFEELACEEAGPGGNTYYQLRREGRTPAGIGWGASIQEVLKTYGVPREPQRSLAYENDWSGKLIYWGTFIPQSDAGCWVDFDFVKGSLVNMTVRY